ncbi:MAG TPA: tyrosine-type recombinase/integrase [Candidatus Acidoferrum sp.]|nr:tyrosine-type recombinase/integrase [Candidatus Acidoferrum sp.]
MGRRAKGEGSLLKRAGCRFWYAQYVHNGKKVRVSTRETSKMRALGALRRLMGDADRGLASLPEAHKLRYADLRRGLIDDYQEKGNRTLKTDADGEETVHGLKQLDEFFGFSSKNPGLRVSEIKPKTSQDFARKRREQGVGNAIINRGLACLRRMLRIAYDDELIQRVPKVHFLKEPPARKGFLELEKFDELVNLLPTHLKPLIIFLYYCGVRGGEALQIEWSQVDLDAKLIRLEEEQTKGDEARYAPLPAQLVMLLRAIDPKFGKVFDHTNLRVEWQKACAACGLGTRTLVEPEGEKRWPWYKYEGLGIHDMRRSAVRNLVTVAGVPEKVAMKISGHKTRDVFDRYHIVSTTDVTAAMSRLELTASRIGAKQVQKALTSGRRGGASRRK